MAQGTLTQLGGASTSNLTLPQASQRPKTLKALKGLGSWGPYKALTRPLRALQVALQGPEGPYEALKDLIRPLMALEGP